MILVEHHRDLPNLLVFGPAAWHFYPRAEWEQAAARAGLQVVARQKLTPSVTATAFEPQRQESSLARQAQSRKAGDFGARTSPGAADGDL